MLVQHLCVETVEQIFDAFLVCFEILQVLKHSLIHLHLEVVANGILSDEIENHDILQFLAELHVSAAQRAAADLIAPLLVT